MQSLLLLIAVSFAGLLILLVILRIIKKRHSASHRMRTILKPYAEDELKRIIIPDGLGGLLEIEYLVRLKQGLLLIETYPMQGHIFGAEKIDKWTQIMQGKSYKFDNPFYHIWNSRQSLKALVPHIPIYCRVVFTDDAIFPKGKPEEVSTLDTLAADIQFLSSEKNISQQAEKAWMRILRIARKDGKTIMGKGKEHDG